MKSYFGIYIRVSNSVSVLYRAIPCAGCLMVYFIVFVGFSTSISQSGLKYKFYMASQVYLDMFYIYFYVYV